MDRLRSSLATVGAISESRLRFSTTGKGYRFGIPIALLVQSLNPFARLISTGMGRKETEFSRKKLGFRGDCAITIGLTQFGL